MQYRIYDRQRLAYVDGGFVASYDIDDDYIVNNNSTVSIIKKTVAHEGDVIVLIQTSGAFHKGIVTSVDNAALKIYYKSDKELFNDNMLNLMAQEFSDDSDLEIAGKIGLNEVSEILKSMYAERESSEQGEYYDSYKALPLEIITLGDAEIFWTWSDDEINISDWLVELFEKYNVTLSWTIDFDMTTERFADRSPKYVVTLSAITNNGGIIKDNVVMQTVSYTKREIPDVTVCRVIDGSSKEILGVYYLYEENGVYSVCKDKNLESYNHKILAQICPIVHAGETKKTTFHFYEGDIISVTVPDDGGISVVDYDSNSVTLSYTNRGVSDLTDYEISCEVYYKLLHRVLPIKTKIVSYDSSGTNETTVEDAAKDSLIPSKFNQAIEVKINADSKTFDFQNVRFGDLYKIINEYGSVDSVYTGKKQADGDKFVTLYFGLGRQNYTDLIQIQLRKQRYSVVYNQKKR